MLARNAATPTLIAVGCFVALVIVVGVLEERLSPSPQPLIMSVVESPPVGSNTEPVIPPWPLAARIKEEEDNAAYRVSQSTAPETIAPLPVVPVWSVESIAEPIPTSNASINFGNQIDVPEQTPGEALDELVRRNQRGFMPDPVVEAILSEPCGFSVADMCGADKAERISDYYDPGLTDPFGSDWNDADRNSWEEPGGFDYGN